MRKHLLGLLLAGEAKTSITLDKAMAHRLIDELPPDATWGDLMYEIYVIEAIERGLADCRAGRTISTEQLRAKFGLSE